MAPARIFSDFASLTAALPRLHALSCSRGSFFSSLPWFQNLHTHGVADTPRLHLLANECGCLPLMRQGNTLTSLSNYYSSLYAPMGELPGNTAALLRELPPCTEIRLAPLATETATYDALRAALRAAGYWVDDYFCFGNWYLRTEGISFADYLATRPAQLRSNIHRGHNKLNAAGSWQIEIQQDADARLEANIDAFVHVYQRSWKTPEPTPDFMPGLCRTAAREGWLRLGVLRLNGKAIAAQLWLVHHGVASIYKLAYDEDAARYSAGTVLSAALFAHAMDKDQVAEIDYLTGDEPYKRDWMTQRRERRGIVGFNLRQWRGLTTALRHGLGCFLKRAKGQRA